MTISYGCQIVNCDSPNAKQCPKKISNFGNVKLHGLYFTFGPLRSVWPTLFLLNVFTALKGTHFYILFNGNL